MCIRDRGDYSGTVTAVFTIEKAVNPAEAPKAAEAVYGQKLEEITLAGGWRWSTPQERVEMCIRDRQQAAAKNHRCPEKRKHGKGRKSVPNLWRSMRTHRLPGQARRIDPPL